MTDMHRVVTSHYQHIASARGGRGMRRRRKRWAVGACTSARSKLRKSSGRVLRCISSASAHIARWDAHLNPLSFHGTR